MKRRKTYAPPQSRMVMLTLEGFICVGSRVDFVIPSESTDSTNVDIPAD